MPFQFIDNNNAIGPEVRRQIRRHAATGKNVGKTIKRRSRKTVLPSPSHDTTTQRTHGVDCEGNAPLEALTFQGLTPGIQRQIGDSLSVLCLPVRVSPETGSVVKQG